MFLELIIKPSVILVMFFYYWILLWAYRASPWKPGRLLDLCLNVFWDEGSRSLDGLVLLGQLTDKIYHAYLSRCSYLHNLAQRPLT